MGTVMKLLKPTSFKLGCFTILLSILFFLSFGQEKPFFLVALDNHITDAMFRFRGPVPVSGQVVIIDIDEKSLKEIGQWPWPRNIVAALVKSIHEQGVKVLGFDIVFAEQDRTSPLHFLPKISMLTGHPLTEEEMAALEDMEELNNDLILGKTVSEGKNVLGYVFQEKKDILKIESDKPFPSIMIQVDPKEYGYKDIPFLKAFRAIINVEEVAQAETEGFFNVDPDQAGMVRKVPLFMELDGIPYPSLALEMARIGLSETSTTIHLSKHEKAGKRDVFEVSLADRRIPTDPSCQVTVNYRGAPFSFAYASAVDVLKGRRSVALKDKYAIIGTSAAGLLDLRATPFSNKFAGVEIHATVIDNILAGDLFKNDVFTENFISLLVILCFGLILCAVLSFAGPFYGGIGGVMILLGITVGNYRFYFLKNEIIGMAYPFLTFLVILILLSLFNYFSEGREKKFIQNAFGHYVSPQVVEELVKQPERLSLKGEQKELTIFFSDIRDFTTISESLGSHRLSRLLNEYLTAMSDIVMAHQGMVDKFIGDAIMAVWGAPLHDKHHAKNAVRASLRMMGALKELEVDWGKKGFPRITIGVGVNTGIVSVGNFGSHSRFDYTVIGDNVNLASRLEGLNKTYGTSIIVSEYTKAAMGDGFFLRLLDFVRVKGKKEATRIYELICEGTPDPVKREEVALFEDALADYRSKHFKEALAKMKKIAETYPAILYTMYVKRIESYIKSPPPEDWDGVFMFKEK